jgi:hypothetical protein
MRRKITYDPRRDYYSILNIDTHATTDDIRRAFRQRVRAVHPDLNPERAAWATKQIQLVNEAYGVLSNRATRREYDKLRWPHVQHAPPRPQRATRYSAPPYDPDRPWWEVVAERTPRGYPFAAGSAAAGYQPTAARHPIWRTVSDWLRRHRLGILERTAITLTGLWRSPYAGLLAALTLVLAFNVALIVYSVMNPAALDPLEDWIRGRNTIAEQDQGMMLPTATPAFMMQSCTDSHAAITQPVSGDVVGNEFSVYGTVNRDDLWAYEIAIGYLGMSRRATEPDRWETVRAAPVNQSFAEQPVNEGLLTETPITLSGELTGYYAIRLRVLLRNGDVLAPCDVIVLH